MSRAISVGKRLGKPQNLAVALAAAALAVSFLSPFSKRGGGADASRPHGLVITNLSHAWTLAANPSPSYSSNGTITACVGTQYQEVSLPNPQRVLDTRTSNGYSGPSPAPANSIIKVSVGSVIPGAVAVVGTVTLTNAQPGYATLWADGTPQPLASNINVSIPNETIANLAVVPLSSAGVFDIYIQSSANVIFDVSGGLYPVNNAVNLLPASSSSCPSGYTPVTWGQSGIYAYTTPGTYTYTPPAGVSYLKVEAIGGGGGGGGSGPNPPVGSGGGGALAIGVIPVSGCGQLAIQVGAGGAAGTPSTSGGNGTDSFVTCSAPSTSGPPSGGVKAGGGAGGGSGGGGAAPGGSPSFQGAAIGLFAASGGNGVSSLGSFYLPGGNSGGGTGGGSCPNNSPLVGVGGGGPVCVQLVSSGALPVPGPGGNGFVLVEPVTSLA
jgi:hypothetical protein